MEDGWDVLLRLEPAGGETAADDPPNGTGESLKKFTQNSNVIQTKPAKVTEKLGCFLHYEYNFLP